MIDVRVVGTDIETTGLEAEKGHKIIEVAIHIADLVFDHSGKFIGSKQLGKTFTRRFNPKRSIDPKAQAVHKISLTDLSGEAEWEKGEQKINKLLGAGSVLVCHNVGFDVPFLAHELMRIGETPPDVELFCTMEQGRGATPLGSIPNLGALCWALDVDYDPEAAHAADYDIDKTMECLTKGLATGLYDFSQILIPLGLAA